MWHRSRTEWTWGGRHSVSNAIKALRMLLCVSANTLAFSGRKQKVKRRFGADALVAPIALAAATALVSDSRTWVLRIQSAVRALTLAGF